MTKPLEQQYNGYYHDKPRRVFYGKGKLSDIPPCPHWIELWLSIIQQQKDEEKKRQIDLEYKRKYNRKIKNTRRICSRNKFGYKGVTYNRQRNKYVTHIYINGKNKYLGSFDNPKDAGKAYKKELEKLNKESV